MDTPFGYTGGATISNVGLVNASVTGNYDVGALVGYLGGSSSITNAYAAGSVSVGDTAASAEVANQGTDIIVSGHAGIDQADVGNRCPSCIAEWGIHLAPLKLRLSHGHRPRNATVWQRLPCELERIPGLVR